MKNICPKCHQPVPDSLEFVEIGYKQIPKKLFEKWGLKPFKIMKKKMRNLDGEISTNINYSNSRKKCQKLGGDLPDIQMWLLLLDAWKVSGEKDKDEFLGIEELGSSIPWSEWSYVQDDVAGLRSGGWAYGADAGRFALYLDIAPGDADGDLGFRCALR